jgi:glucose-fructose oxidoreductase
MDDRQDPIGYAVVGLGWISQAAMLPAFDNVRHNSRLVALVSGNADKRRQLATRYELDRSDTYDYDGLETCLERDDVHAVYIAVPNHLHREYTERAAAAGAHVLCEKPMAPSEEDCHAMIAAAETAGVKLMIAYRLHLDPVHLDIIDRIQTGAIGPTRAFSSTFTQQVAEGDVRLVPPGQGGGPLYDIGVYCLNAARYLFRAEPEAVWATRATRPQERFDMASEMMSCVLRFPDERLATFTCSFGAHAVDVFHLVGDDGELRLDGAYGFRGEKRLDQVGGRGGDESLTFPAHDQFGSQLAYFSDCIREDRQPETDGQEGLVDVRIIQALYESIESGAMVEVDATRDRRPTPDMAVEYPAVEEPELVEIDEPSG